MGLVMSHAVARSHGLVQSAATGLLLLAAVACSDWPGVNKSSDAGLAGGARFDDNSGNLGSSCGSNVKCYPGLTCVTQAPGGLCTKNCSSDADCSGGSCQSVPSWGGMICLKTCASDQMCRTGYRCVSAGRVSVCA
jgi:hypothetical protein